MSAFLHLTLVAILHAGELLAGVALARRPTPVGPPRSAPSESALAKLAPVDRRRVRAWHAAEPLPPAARRAAREKIADDAAARPGDPELARRLRFSSLMDALRAGDVAAVVRNRRKLTASGASPEAKAEAWIIEAKAHSKAGDHEAAIAAVERLPRVGVRGLTTESAVQRSAARARVYAAAGRYDAARLSYLSEAPPRGDVAMSRAYYEYGAALPAESAAAARKFEDRLLLKAPAGVTPNALFGRAVRRLQGGDAAGYRKFRDLLTGQYEQSGAAARSVAALADFATLRNRPADAERLYEWVLANPNAPPDIARHAADELASLRETPGPLAPILPRPDDIGGGPAPDVERDPAKIDKDDL